MRKVITWTRYDSEAGDWVALTDDEKACLQFPRHDDGFPQPDSWVCYWERGPDGEWVIGPRRPL